MRNVTQYLMFVQSLVLTPLLLYGSALLFKNHRSLNTLFMLVGTLVMLIGGSYTALLVARGGDMSTMPAQEIMAIQHHLTISGAVSYIGIAIFVCGFVLYALRSAKLSTQSNFSSSGRDVSEAGADERRST